MHCSLSYSLIFTHTILLPRLFESISRLLSFSWPIPVGHTDTSLSSRSCLPQVWIRCPSYVVCLLFPPHCVIIACLLICIPWHSKLCETQGLGLFYSLLYPQYLAYCLAYNACPRHIYWKNAHNITIE